MTWSVVHVDLRAGVSPRTDGTSPVYIVWWWGALPLGTTSHLPEELPLASDQLRGLAASLGARQIWARSPNFGGIPGAASDGVPTLVLSLEAAAGDIDVAALDRWSVPSASTGENLSVIVCTRDRPEALRTCLRSLSAQRAPAAEIVVVDNSQARSAAGVAAEFPNVLYVHEPRPGLSVARNTGIRRSSRPLVAFTDDDVEVEAGWTSEMVAAFDSDPGAEAICGLVAPASLESTAQRYFQFEIGGLGGKYLPIRFDQRFLDASIARGPQVWRVGAGANMAFRREVFDRVGNFDERLGAGAAGCSEDSELWYRIIANGGACLYEPRVAVRHHHRTEWNALVRQVHAYMKGHTAALLVQHALHGHRGNLRRAFLQLPRYFVHSGIDALLGWRRRRASILYAEVTGWIAGIACGYRLRKGQRA